jgi:hypothetical protein
VRVGDAGGDGRRQREAEKETNACAPNHVLVHVLASPQELQREVLNVSIAERLRRPDYAGQISFHQVKHQIERTERLLEARLDHLAEPHNVRVDEQPQKANFPKCTLSQCPTLKDALTFLHSHEGAAGTVAHSTHATISALAQEIHNGVLLRHLEVLPHHSIDAIPIIHSLSGKTRANYVSGLSERYEGAC